jgi:DNA-binding NarL/FixJ family response regulator
VIRVLLSVPSPALRAGLRALLSSDNTIEIVSNSPDEELEADVVITSASSDSFSDNEFDPPSQAFRPLDTTSPARTTPGSLRPDALSGTQAAILFLSDHRASVLEMRRLSRVWGILPTDVSAEELTAAVHALSQGLIVGTATLLFESESEPLAQGPLTDRELEVLGLLSKGLANKQIAVALGISEHTVKFHVSSIYTKLNVTNRTEAVRAGLRGGWIAL